MSSSALRDAAVPLLSLSSNNTNAVHPSLVGVAAAAAQRSPPPTTSISSSATPTVAQHVGSDQNNHGLSSFQWVLLGGLVLQYTAASLMWIHSNQAESVHGSAHPSQVTLTVEVVKLVVSIAMEFHFFRTAETTGMSHFSTMHGTLLFVADSLRSAIPPMLYMLQQIFVNVGISAQAVKTAMLEMRAKLLMVAAVSVHLLHKRYSRISWICLGVFTISEELEVLSDLSGFGLPFPGVGTFLFTIVVIGLAALMGAVATVYSEKIMKQSTTALFSDSGLNDTGGVQVSFWMHCLQFSLFGTLAAALLVLPVFHEVPLPPFGRGFTFRLWVVILAQASAGIWLLAVIKYTDSIFSVMAIFVSYLATDMILMVFAGSTKLTVEFALGAVLKVTSLYFYCKHYRPETASTEPERLMDEGDTTVELGELLGGANGWHAERRSADSALESLYLTEESVASPHDGSRRF
jgi:Nucleotide-sugar transporter